VDGTMKSVIRAATWNIHEGIMADGSGKEQAEELVETLIDSDIDVLALQEVPFNDDGESPILQMISTCTQLRYASGFWLSRSFSKVGNFAGVAVASRAPHSVEARRRLPNPHLRVVKEHQEWRSWDKGMITVKIDLHHGSLWVASVHCYPFHEFGRCADEEEFAPIWSTLADAINEIPGTAIIAGDFNTDRRYLFTGLLGRPHLASSFEGTATHGDKSVDDILHDIKLIRHSSSSSLSFSDHTFCQADFSFQPELSMDLSEAASMLAGAFNPSADKGDDLQAAARVLAQLARRSQLLKIINTIRDDAAIVQHCAAMSGRHPLGHDKITLIDAEASWRLRLHAWWPSRIPGVEHVHHHRFNFSTIMVRGHYQMQTFQRASSGTEMIEYHQRSDTRAGEWYLASAGVAHLQLRAATEITEGVGYSLDADALHRVLVPPDTLCLTLFLAIIANADLSSETRVFALPNETAPAVIKSQTLSADDYRRRLDAIAVELTSSCLSPSAKRSH
jgi:endonuclease/exonuclease/phosphatase family metal-dependent hydrolase